MSPKKAAVETNVDPMEKLARLAAIYITKDMSPEDAAASWRWF